MPRQFGKLDRSVAATWRCARCLQPHEPGSGCPPLGVWLVLRFCPACREDTGYYCSTHRGQTP